MVNILFPEWEITSFKAEGNSLKLNASSSNLEGACPDCDVVSKRIHSYYKREPRDLPISQWAIEIELNTKRFRCLNKQCERKTFAEDYGEFLPRYAHRCKRLKEKQQIISLYLSAETGETVLSELNMPVSADSLLNNLHSLEITEVGQVRILGIDDWAFKKGRNYGTILVNLETHETIDLLSDRTSDTAIAWIEKHPEIEVVSRDRAKEYKQAATQAAPQAEQVADRWHLLVNLSDHIKNWLYRHRNYLVDPSGELDTKAVTQQHSTKLSDLEKLATMKAKNTFEQKHLDVQKTRAKRFKQYEEVKQLREQGLTWSEISAKVGKGSTTIRRWLRTGVPTKYRKSILDAYKPYIKERFEAGCNNSGVIFREIQTSGYEGSIGGIQQYMALLRAGIAVEQGEHINTYLPNQPLLFSHQEACLLFTTDKTLFSDKDTSRLDLLLDTYPEAKLCYDLCREFFIMIQTQNSNTFETWLQKAKDSRIKEMKSFAKGIQSDFKAVKNAIDLPWSNGIVEGKVNKLKYIKRQMYGRASFDLLRKKILLLK